MFAAGALAFIVAALLIMLIFRLVFGRRLRVPGSARSRQPRLGLVDAYDLDKERQLVIVRRDNVEHLIMIGGPNDLVIESQIVRVEGRAERAPKDAKDQPSLPMAPIGNAPKARAPEPESTQIDLPLPPEAPADLVVNEPPKPAGISRPRWLGSRNADESAPVAPVPAAPVPAAPVPAPVAPVVTSPRAVVPPVTPAAPVVAPKPAADVPVSFEDLEAELLGASAPVAPPVPVAPPAPQRPAAPQVRPYEPRVEPRPAPSLTPPPFLRPASPSTQAGEKPAGTFGRTTAPLTPPRQLSGQEGVPPVPPRTTYTPRPLTTPTLPKVEPKPVEAKPAEPVAPVEAKVEPKVEAKPAEIVTPVEPPKPAPVAPKLDAPVPPTAPKLDAPVPQAPKPEPAPSAPKVEAAKPSAPDLDVLDSLEEEMAKLLGRPQG